MNVNTGNKILVTAADLKAGMTISGKFFEAHTVTYVQQREDDVLGRVVQFAVRGERTGNHVSYTMRTYDKLWILG